jgi:hypothetical protein
LKDDGLKIQVSPISLNKDEKLFVDKLKYFTESNKEIFNKKNLYLLHNKSKGEGVSLRQAIFSMPSRSRHNL